VGHVCYQAGREKVLPQLLGNSADSDNNTVHHFELELQWCIQQLEGALSRNKMTPEQGTLPPQALQNSIVFWSLKLSVSYLPIKVQSFSSSKGRNKLQVFENAGLKKYFDPKKGKLIGEWRKLHNEKCCNFYSFLLL
jgi:hypothetical protein